MSELINFLMDVFVFGVLTSNAITLCALRVRITDIEKRINKLNSLKIPNNSKENE